MNAHYYWLYCISTDGDSRREGPFPGEKAAWIFNENMGSRWFFYPFRVVVLDDKIVAWPDSQQHEGYEDLHLFCETLRDNEDFRCHVLSSIGINF